MTNQTTVSLRPDHKPAVDRAQEALAAELGFKPSKGETVVKLCKDYVQSRE